MTLEKGFRLWKLTQYDQLRDPLSSWWSSVLPFRENDMGAKAVFEAALLNQVSLRDFVRFSSAISLDWNLLSFYLELELIADTKAYWGQFAPMAAIQTRHEVIPGVELSEKKGPGGDDTMVHYDDSRDASSTSYLPDILGGFGAWQLYVPNFKKAYITLPAVVTVKAADNQQMAEHFGMSQSRIDSLLNQMRNWKNSS